MRARVRIALSLVSLAICALVVGFSAASFTDTSQNPQTVSAVPDFLAPTASASTITKSQGGVAGYVKKGGTYYVYANVTDSGNPASGIASVKANVAEITSGQTAVSLTTSGGPYLVDGVSYAYRSAQLTAGSGLSAGSESYSLALTDTAGNSRSQGFTVTVDNGPFAAGGFDTANGSGGESGEPEQGDTVTFTYDKAPEATSILSKWTGASAASVSVVINQSSSNDSLSVSGTALGSVALKGNYVSKTVTFSSSSMTLSGNSIVIVLGGASSSSTLDENSNRAPVWSPSASAYDRAANACSTATVTSASDRQF